MIFLKNLEDLRAFHVAHEKSDSRFLVVFLFSCFCFLADFRTLSSSLAFMHYMRIPFIHSFFWTVNRSL